MHQKQIFTIREGLFMSRNEGKYFRNLGRRKLWEVLHPKRSNGTLFLESSELAQSP